MTTLPTPLSDDVPDDPDEEGTPFETYVPPELESGVYANALSVWHTVSEFTLDFGSLVRSGDPDDSGASALVRTRVVARVKIPPILIFDVMQVLNESMTDYEAVFGEIRRPEPREDE